MLVKCVAYENGQKLATIEPHDIPRHLENPDRFVWVALIEPDDATLEVFQREFHLHPLAVEDARHGHQQPKIEEYGDQLFAVLHMIEPDGTDLRIGEVDIFVGKQFVMSVRRGAQVGFQDVRDRAEKEHHLLRRGPSYVLYALMDAVVDRYFPVLHAIEEELEDVEERIFSESRPRATIESLYAIKRKVTKMRHAVAPLLESLSNFSGAVVPEVCRGMQEYFRDISDHLQRLDRTIDSLRDTTSTAISVNLSMITLQDSETMKRLAAYAALIAVPTLIAGVYGMNFDVMPELRWRYGYAVTVGVMVLIDAVLFYRLRKAKWL